MDYIHGDSLGKQQTNLDLSGFANLTGLSNETKQTGLSSNESLEDLTKPQKQSNERHIFLLYPATTGHHYLKTGRS